MFTFGSLFAGIGGIDLGLERAGMTCRWMVEIDPFCQKVLAKHWPDVTRYGNVKECGSHNLETVDLIAGGFPCQPHSVAGKRRGAADDRNLWPEFLRIIREVRPAWVLAENVPGIVSLYLDTVLADLEGEDYTCWTFNIPACAFNAPHRRERIFVVAHTSSERIQGVWQKQIPRQSSFSWLKNVRGIEDLRERSDIPEPLFRGTCDGVPYWMDRLRALGNAVVPQVAEWIGRQILASILEAKCYGTKTNEVSLS